MPEPTPQTLSCNRTQNDPFERTSMLRLDKNENTVGYPEDFLRDMLGSITPSMVASYPEPFKLHRRLAEFLGIEEDRLLLSSGSDAAIKNCFETFLNKGDRIIRLNPTYAMVGVYAKLFGVNEITAGYDKRLKLDFDGLIKNIEEGVKLVYIANPNSPTGTVLDIDKLRSVCKEALKRDAIVIVDEAYYYFCDVTVIDLTDEFENLIVVRTFSKAIGLASVRLGYIVSSMQIIGWLSRWRPMYEINTFAQHCGCFILDKWKHVEQYVKEVLETREWFQDEISKIGLEAFDSHANFVLVKFPKEKIPAAIEKFRQEGILIKGGGLSFPLSESLRFSLGVRTQMERCLSILKRSVNYS